ncbi:Polyketide synthase enoylreductase [Penicillium riverlandense]|uniref:Polyketide synthase enoylreductase n=1 Tax=Penicillium riverlandense TaxID=1903569 RepID=UPI0025482C42|nr:Polyketide synthase enoylreductase [Penicillium riverlandense]KAJ5805123.1 Polyketide synthase enoylreductase [Penicillium riverlandense]
MSTTTSTYLQLQEKPMTFHRGFFTTEEQSNVSNSKPEETASGRQLVETKQTVLLLKGVREQYTLVNDHDIPSVSNPGEVLVKVLAIGLNPIDWKAPAFNFGIPRLPWINGRDLAGQVVQVPSDNSRLRVGDIVLVPSTDYRDIRKAAFQEYAITTHYNAARIPSTTSIHASASVGVAFVAAALALGVSFGVDFSTISQSPGPNLVNVVNQLNRNDVPEDIREECFSSIRETERPQRGDWLAIWGGMLILVIVKSISTLTGILEASTTTGLVTLELAKLAGLRVICIADAARYGSKLLAAGADVLVDRQNPDRAVDVIRGVTDGKLRYAMDIVGRDTATLLQKTLDLTGHAHLLGLTGLPKERDERIRYHTVPIKLFHESPKVGESLVCWLENLLQSTTLTLPDIVQADGGLEGINAALETLRDGSVSGKRIVMDLGSSRS